MTSSPSAQPDDRARQAVLISDELGRSHREHFGRGPGSTKTVISKGFVVSFLEDIFTTHEKALITGGRPDIVHEGRQAFQEIMRGPYTEFVETVTGRRVRAFMSQNHIDPELAVEVFVLDPEPDEPSDV